MTPLLSGAKSVPLKTAETPTHTLGTDLVTVVVLSSALGFVLILMTLLCLAVWYDMNLFPKLNPKNKDTTETTEDGAAEEGTEDVSGTGTNFMAKVTNSQTKDDTDIEHVLKQALANL